MVITDKVINDSINSPVRSVKAKAELYNGSALVDTFTDQDLLKSITVERVGEESKFFGFGICQKLNIKLLDSKRDLEIGTANTFKIYFGTTGKYINSLPDFQVSEVHRDEKTNELSITAYDKIYKAASHSFNELSLTLPYSILDVANEAAKALGLLVDNKGNKTFQVSYDTPANFSGSETLREVLNQVAEATQTIYYINNKNILVFKSLDRDGKPVEEITKEKYFSLDSSSNRKLAKIISVTELGDNVEAAASYSGSTQYIRNNGFWELREDIGTLINNALAAVAGTTINQFSCSWRGNYLLEPGDKIALTAKDESVVFSYVLNDSLKYDGTLSEETKWNYKAEEETASNPSTLGEALNKTFARVDKVNKEIELVASKTKENSDSIAQILINTGKVNIKVEKSINKVTILYALGDSRETAPSTGWSTTAPVNDGSRYMWQRTITALNDGTISETITCISGANGSNGKDGAPGAKGEPGKNGAPGKDGINGSNGKDGYTPVKGVDYFDGAKGDKGEPGKDGINGAPGEDGKPGEKGDTGIGVKSNITQYYYSTSNTTQSGGSWGDYQEEQDKGKYIWTRTKTTWTNDTITYTNPVLANSLNDALRSANSANEKITILDKTVSNLQVNNDNITAEVSNIKKQVSSDVKNINDEINTIIQKVDQSISAEDVKIEVSKQLDNGINKVETTTGFTFNENGLNISKTGADLSTQITENGMSVNKGKEAVLVANDSGVDAKNLHATTYLIIGKNSRFEDMGDKTACFFIG